MIDIAHRNAAVALWEAYCKADDEFDAAVENATSEERDRLGDLLDAAQERWQEHSPNLTVDDDGDVVRCAKSGIPLLDDDETVDDWKTGESFLRSELGLPPRKQEETVDSKELETAE